MENQADDENPTLFTHGAASSEVRLEDAIPRTLHHGNSEEKWQQFMEHQSRCFEMFTRTINLQHSPSTELRLPDFDPDKSDVDARARISTATLCINEEQRQGAQLMVALSRALKGQASTWLSTVSFPGMTWSDLELFIQKYDCFETTASFLIKLHDSKPKDNECVATYAASLMTSIMSRCLTTEQLAVAIVLAHVSCFDRRVQRLSFTTEVVTRNQLQQELKTVSFLNRTAPVNDHGTDTKKRRTCDTSTPVKCYYCGNLGHKSTVCLVKRRNYRRSDERLSSTQSNFYKKIPPAGAKPSVTCYRCQAQGHYAYNCPELRNQGSSSSSPSGLGVTKKERVDL